MVETSFHGTMNIAILNLSLKCFHYYNYYYYFFFFFLKIKIILEIIGTPTHGTINKDP